MGMAVIKALVVIGVLSWLCLGLASTIIRMRNSLAYGSTKLQDVRLCFILNQSFFDHMCFI